ncbi:MAG: hypothetical protein ABS68_03720 [Niastella sp. SCN 39-18]|nr:hypothetical protein [Sphingobacteriales bacterium]ODT54071.1 MAG: hypothetical protein ABS68_03720 [Niastella sp. SCN 39-18]
MQKQIFKNVFSLENWLDPLTTQKLEGIIKQYPYFSLAHFFLQKTNKHARETAARTALHFNNLYLLHARLNEPEIIEEQETGNPSLPTGHAMEQKEPLQTMASPIPVNQEQPGESISPGDTAAAMPTTAGEELVFEPLYTSDYFASQGIKLSTEVQPADKLGKQLKSFTDWLKTMKKVHEGPHIPTASDSSVDRLAEKSNIIEEVVTEPMAEVYASQGKIKQALETYQKLSLLHPAKSAYFAAKIENLKAE